MLYVSVMMSMMLVQTRKNTEDVLQVSRNNLKFAACLTLHTSSIHLYWKQHACILKT